MLAGVRLVRRTPVLLGAISLDLFAVLFGGAVALLPVFAKDVLDIGADRVRRAPERALRRRVARRVYLARRPIERYAGRTLLLVVAASSALDDRLRPLALALALDRARSPSAADVDMVSMVLRSTIAPLVTPDELRGRVNAVEMVFISASNELGAFESGVAAALVGAVPAVVIGGAATIVVAVLWTRLFPPLARIDRLDELRPAEAAVF